MIRPTKTRKKVPDLQNIPLREGADKELREAFRKPLPDFDTKNIELCIALDILARCGRP